AAPRDHLGHLPHLFGEDHQPGERVMVLGAPLLVLTDTLFLHLFQDGGRPAVVGLAVVEVLDDGHGHRRHLDQLVAETHRDSSRRRAFSTRYRASEVAVIALPRYRFELAYGSRISRASRSRWSICSRSSMLTTRNFSYPFMRFCLSSSRSRGSDRSAGPSSADGRSPCRCP